jgi:IclR family acetate operon transcriptional repressor
MAEAAERQRAYGASMSLQSVKAALRVLEQIAERQTVGVSDLARSLAISKSTVQRCVMTLYECGWIRPSGDQQTRWSITAKSFSIGRHAADNGHLRETVLPLMEDLRAQTGETIHLVVANGRDAVLIERIDTPHSVRIYIPLGAAGPLHATANGKAILSHYPKEALDRYLGGGLAAMTAKTIVNPDVLRKELALAHKRGFATVIDERNEGASAVAAAIVDRAGAPVGSLSISCPTSRFLKSVRPRYAELIVATAKVAAARLG